MSFQSPSILLVDDDSAVLRGFSRFLLAAGYTVSEAVSLAEARALMGIQRFEAVILDLYLPDGKGIDWISELREDHPGLSIIMMTGEADVPTAVEAMRRGGDNLLVKPVNMQELDIVLRKSLEVGELRQKDFVRRRLQKNRDYFWGKSPAMQETMRLARLAAQSESPVLIQGETGAGKGVLCRWIHDNSSHRSGEMVEVNCSSLKGELLASELFGHVRGAFTSAVQDRAGLIEVADGGTLFLDEIGDMDISVQAQFLKVIEEKQFRSIGDVKVRRSDFRLICATNGVLREKVESRGFREDLLFRINVFPIHLPPLRERLEDLPELIEFLLRDLGSPGAVISPELKRLFEEYTWPGNIRELKNVLERALILAGGGSLDSSHLPELRPRTSERAREGGESRSLDLASRNHILEVMESVGSDTKKAASLLGMSRSNLYRKLKKIRQKP